MKGFVVAVIVVLAASFFFASQAISAEAEVSSLCEGITLPNLSACWGSSNFSFSDGNNPEGYSWFYLRTPYEVKEANWNFWVNSQDTQFWTANLSVLGLLHENSSSGTRNSRSHIAISGIEIAEDLDTDRFLGSDGKEQNRVLWSMRVSPSSVISENFSYSEYPDLYGLEMKQWMGQYCVSGKFLASSTEEARQLGAQFASVPEPSSICLLSALLFTGGIICWRKKR